MHRCLRKCVLFLYADDSTLVHTAASNSILSENMNSDLISLSAYCAANALLINNSKTKIMFFGSPRIHDSIYLGNFAVDVVESFTILGLIIDRNMKFKSQVAHVSKKLCTASYILRKYRKIIPQSALVLLFNCIGGSHLDFNSICYYDCLSAGLNAQLSRNYIHCARALLPFEKNKSGSVLLEELSWLPLNERIRDLKIIFIIKLLKTGIPSDLFSVLERVNHHHSTRYASYGFILNRSLKNIGAGSFSSWGPRLASTLSLL